jgi:RNA polymerase sigma-70 factor, ECF subfamily
MGITADMDLSDADTFARAYDEHGPAVYGTALRVLGNPAAAQDVAQDVFMRLMARSRALDLWRSAQAGGRATDRLKIASGRDEARLEEQPVPRFERTEHRATVRAALGTLPEPQREAVVLAYWGGLTADEIARRSGVPLGTAKSRVRLGLQRMRAELERRRDELDLEPVPAVAEAA